MNKAVVPLVVFVALGAVLAVGLTRDPREIPSPLIDKPAPAFKAPRLGAADQSFSRDDMKGKVWLINVWASWCVACREEHPLLTAFARERLVPLIGLDYKDEAPAALDFLAQRGDPYDLSVMDRDGRIGIDFGVYGVPETFVIDKAGVIRYKQIGPLTAEVLRDKIKPLIAELQQ